MSRLSGFEGTSSSQGKELSKMLESPGEKRIQTGTSGTSRGTVVY